MISKVPSFITLQSVLPILCLGGALALAPSARAVQGARLSPVAPAASADQASEFGAPLVVGGVRISDMQIKRALVYGPGRNALEARKLQVLMNHETALRRSNEREGVLEEMPPPPTDGMAPDAAAAAKKAHSAAVDAEVERRMQRYAADMRVIDRRLDEEKTSFEERYPTLDHEVELRRAYTSGRWYREQVAQTMNFDALFFPGHPDTWPDLSRESIQAGAPQVDLLADYGKEYERRLQVSVDTDQPIVPEQEMMMGLLRDFVMNALWSLADIQTATGGIPEHLVMIVDGGDWRSEIETQDVFDEMRPYFSDDDVQEAKHFLALMEATRQRMQKDGILMSDQEFSSLVAENNVQMQGAMFNMEFLALQGHGFPSQEAFNEHLRLVESLRRSLGDSLEIDPNAPLPPDLAEHLTTANAIMGLARAEVEVLFVSAYDFPNFRWHDDGWEKARVRATGLRRMIDEYLGRLAVDAEARASAEGLGVTHTTPDDLLPFDQWWRNFLDANSDYWDPPLPVVGKSPPALGLKNKGRFQDEPMTRNDMKRAIGESEFTHFMFNDAIVDKVFFDLDPGTIGGPFKGPKGYYILFVESRTAPTNPLRMSEERHRKMLQEDYIRKAFQRYAHASLREAQVSGI